MPTLGSRPSHPTAPRWRSPARPSPRPSWHRESRCASCGSARSSARSPPTGIGGPRRSPGPPTAPRLIVTADEGGRGPVFAVDPATSAVTPLTARRLLLHRRARRARWGALRAAQLLRGTAAPGAHRSRRDRDGAAVRRAARAARRGDRGDRHRRRRHAVRSWLALPDRGRPGAAGAVDPRRPAGQLERLALAVEPMAAGRAGIRRAAARPGAVDGLRAGLHPARLGRMGFRPVHRSDGRHRRRVCTSPGRRIPHRGDGRLVRRLHGQLDRRAHRPFRRDRHPRQPVGARPVRADHRRRVLVGARDDDAR